MEVRPAPNATTRATLTSSLFVRSVRTADTSLPFSLRSLHSLHSHITCFVALRDVLQNSGGEGSRPPPSRRAANQRNGTYMPCCWLTIRTASSRVSHCPVCWNTRYRRYPARDM